MDARIGRPRWALPAACVGVILGGWAAGTRAETPAAEDASIMADGRPGVVITTEGGLAHRLLAGLVAFNAPGVPTPPDVPPTGIPPDVPLPPVSPEVTVYPPDMAPAFNVPDTPPANSGAPEPNGLLMGLIGSACAGAAVFGRRLTWAVR